MWDLMAKTSYGIVNILGILQVNSYDLSTGTDCISNNSNSTSLQSALFKHMYVVVIFFISGNLYFSFVSTSLSYITIPKSERKTKIT